MVEAMRGKEVVLTLKNRPGLQLEMSKFLAEKGVSILALIGAVTGSECLIRLVTDDNLRTMDALTERGYSPVEGDVIILNVSHKPGMLRRISEVLTGEEIDIRYIYATALSEHERCLMVLHTDNNELAFTRLCSLKAA